MMTPDTDWQDDIEATIGRIWTAVLGGDAIGREQPFIDAGGDSLLAMQAAALVSEHFGVEVPATVLLFACPTIATLAEHVATCLASPPAAPATFHR